jgi:phosphoglycolate phosphatase-like HAD superfamily hydrolase
VKALVLDFDGVLCASGRETFAVGLATYLGLEPRSALAGADRASLEAGFLAAMPLGNRAEDFGVVLAAQEHGVAIADQAAYDAFRETIGAGWLRAFHARFYQERAALARRDPAGWIALNPPYGPFLALLRRRAAEARFAIATAKDHASVERLLGAWGAGDLFDPALVLDKEAGVGLLEARHPRLVQSTFSGRRRKNVFPARSRHSASPSSSSGSGRAVCSNPFCSTASSTSFMLATPH